MAFRDRIEKFFRRTPAEVTTADETAQVQRMVQPPIDTGSRFRADADRNEIVRQCREMYRTDPRVRRIISTLARDVVRGGCSVVVSNSPDAELEARALLARLNLNRRLDDWMRLSFRDGDSMLELGVTAALDITTVTRKPTLQMQRASNDRDLFDNVARAFWFAEGNWAMPDPPSNALWFAEWQIVHARWDHDEGSRYGLPLFAAATSAFKRVKEGEIDIAVRRKTRAGMKFNHKFPEGTTQESIEAYKEINQAALDEPFAAVSDYFGTVDISAIQGDARLQEIDDVRHHIKTLSLAGILPLELVGYGEELNRDVLEEKKAQYDRDLETITQWLEDEMVKPIVERQWLLKGFFPARLKYEVKWKSKQVLTAAVLRDVADALLRMRALGFSDKVLATILEKFLPGMELDMFDLSQRAEDTERVASDAERLGSDK